MDTETVVMGAENVVMSIKNAVKAHPALFPLPGRRGRVLPHRHKAKEYLLQAFRGGYPEFSTGHFFKAPNRYTESRREFTEMHRGFWRRQCK